MSILKQERENFGKTQLEVAKDLGISYSMLQQLEQGRRGASDKTKIKISKYYGKSVEYLFFNKNITKSN